MLTYIKHKLKDIWLVWCRGYGLLSWVDFTLTRYFIKKSLLFYKLADLSITIPQRRRILNYVIILCGGSFKIENSIYLYTFKSIQIHVSIFYLAPIWHFNTLEHQYPNISIHLLLLYYLEFRLYYRISIVCNCLNLSQLGILRFEWYYM